MHILENSRSCIDLIFTSQLNSGVYGSLHPNCYHQLIFCLFILNVFIYLLMKGLSKITYKRTLMISKEQLIDLTGTVQKMKFFIMDFFSKCDQICLFLWIWSHLLKKSLMEHFIFCAGWEAILSNHDVNVQVLIFNELISNILKSFIPSEKILWNDRAFLDESLHQNYFHKSLGLPVPCSKTWWYTLWYSLRVVLNLPKNWVKLLKMQCKSI